MAAGPSPDAGLTYRYFDVDAKHVRVGANILAVETHRSHPTQGNLRFDLTLSTKPEKKPAAPGGRASKTVPRSP